MVHIGKGQEAGEPALSEEGRLTVKRKSGPFGDAENLFALSWEVLGLWHGEGTRSGLEPTGCVQGEGLKVHQG